MDYLKKEHMICLNINEMKKLIANKLRADLMKEIEKENIDVANFKNDNAAMQDFTNELVQRNRSNKELTEFFIATSLANSVYNSENTKICFELKSSVQPKKLSVTNFNELKNVIEESTMTDFAILFDGNLRKFQLKQYQKALETDTLIESIKSIIDSYGRRLGKHNLIIQIQGNNENVDLNGMQVISIDYHAIHEALVSYGIEGVGEILLSINVRNEKELLIQVFPELNKFETSFNFTGEDWM